VECGLRIAEGSLPLESTSNHLLQEETEVTEGGDWKITWDLGFWICGLFFCNFLRLRFTWDLEPGIWDFPWLLEHARRFYPIANHRLWTIPPTAFKFSHGKDDESSANPAGEGTFGIS
jgi:hypothetical protein